MTRITGPKDAIRFFKPRLKADTEEFWAVALNTDKVVVAATCLFRGTVDHCLFHARDVFRFGCVHNASSIIVAHNHPSGSPQPSEEDLRVTRQLITAAEVIGIPVVDHIIVGKRKCLSFIEARLLPAISGPASPNGRESDQYSLFGFAESFEHQSRPDSDRAELHSRDRKHPG